MAVKWAVANGNWNAGATWNGGVVPTIGDIIYLDGHTISAGLNINLGAGEIHNDINPITGLSGGRMNGSGAYVVAAAKFISQTYLFYQYATGSIFNGNFYSSSVEAPLYRASGTASSYTINGNVYLTNNGTLTAGLTSTTSYTIINGNLMTSSTSNTININNELIINGNITLLSNALIRSNKLTINGNILYENTNCSIPIQSLILNILNPDTFTWKDVTEPRSNPFIILTNADMNNRQQYPPENEVKEGTEYVWGEKVGTYQQPPESVVLKGYVYDNGDKIGSLENQNIVGCVTKEDVREGVPLIGMYEDGQQVVGTIVIPAEEDVREGVHYDNNKVGTLIVQGGGDRLRIADFGYYTNAQSDTYIVDLTEQDKPKFAVAEERVLIEMFPDLDFDNIPDKYFDDLFVKYLKYRLIVEYYRTAGINSTFTPSEPTTEIVNYRNVNCEIWMNIANTYLKAWGEKYPNSIKKQRILL